MTDEPQADPREAILGARLDPRVHGPRTTTDTAISLPAPDTTSPHAFERALDVHRQRDPETGRFIPPREQK